jgi:mannose-6-phosphate isomerase-like protein (cupin superfamily)
MPNRMNKTAVVSLADALRQGPPPPGNLAVPIFAHGSLIVELYTPQGHDPQKPHTRDEIYFVVRGEGFFFDGTQKQALAPGAFIFVAAGQIHRFEDFSSDFTVWVAFYGPEGGEKSPAAAQRSS